MIFLGASISIDWLQTGEDAYQRKISGSDDYPEAVTISEDGRLPPPYAHTERRMYILLVDTLRYETAIDPDLMPNLIGLQNKSTYGYMRNSIDAVTVPSVKAAFTGVDGFSLFNVVENFKKGNVIPSVFTQLNQEGVSISCYTDITFRIFDHDITDYNELDRRNWKIDDYRKIEQEAIDDSMEDYIEREHDLVIMHLLIPHDINHRYGPDHADFPGAFRSADETIKRLDELIPDDEYLLVMGDHGHTDSGRHQYGLDVPTYYSIRGPGFEKNNELPIAITDIRFLVSWAMGVPLPEDYSSGRYPDALNSTGPLPEGFAEEYISLDHPRNIQSKVLSGNMAEYAVTIIHLGVLISLFLMYTYSDNTFTTIPIWKELGGFLSALFLFVPSYLPLSGILGICMGGAVMASFLYNRAGNPKLNRRNLKLTALSMGGTLFFLLWGYLWVIYVSHNMPRYDMPKIFWPAFLLIGLVITNKKGPQIATWVVFLIPFFLLFPTSYSYGWIGSMGPALILWACFYWWSIHRASSIERISSVTKRGFGKLEKTGGRIKSLFISINAIRKEKKKILGRFLIPIIFVGILFSLMRGINYQFRYWVLQWWLFPFALLAVIGLAAKFVLFMRSSNSKAAHAWVSSIVLIVFFFEMRFIDVGKYVYIVILSLMILTWLAFRKSRYFSLPALERFNDADRKYIRNAMMLAFLSLLYYYTIRAPVRYYIWADMLMAAIFLAASFLKKYVERKQAESGYTFIAILSLMVGGWVTLAWGLHNLEWFFLYDWFPETVLETYLIFFMPFIVARFMLPVLMIRTSLSDVFQNKKVFTQDRVFVLAGLKLLSIIMIFYGTGYDSTSELFFDGVQESAIWMIMIIALL